MLVISRTMTTKSRFCKQRPTPVETHPCGSWRSLQSFDLPARESMGNFLQSAGLSMN
jgi:hypothetical protein